MYPVQVPCFLSEEVSLVGRLQSDVSFGMWDEQLDMVGARLDLVPSVEARASTPDRQSDTWDLDASSSPMKPVELIPGQLQVTVLWVLLLYFSTLKPRTNEL